MVACNEIVAGEHHEDFVIDMLEGSGGTSINMNANEVIANRALQILGQSPGDYRRIHPNDHVNLGQSTNDVVPTALKLACYEQAQPLLEALEQACRGAWGKINGVFGRSPIGANVSAVGAANDVGPGFRRLCGGYHARPRHDRRFGR